jgi:hypothetical protein
VLLLKIIMVLELNRGRFLQLSVEVLWMQLSLIGNEDLLGVSHLHRVGWSNDRDVDMVYRLFGPLAHRIKFILFIFLVLKHSIASALKLFAVLRQPGVWRVGILGELVTRGRQLLLLLLAVVLELSVAH